MLPLWSVFTEVTRGEGFSTFWQRDSDMSDAESLCESKAGSE